MRLNAIELSWFRGAADRVSLELGCKSMVVYGVNGSGKSSFVDAVEYVLDDGRIRHLAHEYSGKHQENAIPNTHKPPDRQVEFRITFKDGSELRTEIARDGSAICSGVNAAAMHRWDYQRTVLRQNEVAEFISATKGGKYSALLPLLGLDQMEVAAENLRRLAKSVQKESHLEQAQFELKTVKTDRETTFGADSDDEIVTKIKRLRTTYCADKTTATDPLTLCAELKLAIDARIAESSTDQRQYVALQDAANLGLADHIGAVRSATKELADAIEPLITEKLEVLESTGGFVDRLEDGREVQCPACGQPIPVDAFRAHVAAERKRLQEIDTVFKKRKAAVGTLCDTVKLLQVNLGKPDVESWRAEMAKGPLASNFACLDGIDVEELRKSRDEEDLDAFEVSLLPLIAAAASACGDAPPSAQQLSTDTDLVKVGQAVIAAIDKVGVVERAETLISVVQSLEQGIRNEIRLRSQAIIDEISSDIQRMWAILHPNEAIEGIRLYLPDGADKAIDVCLTYHGVEQGSPRLTLSEGYRNSLGLCIFLAMAKQEADRDRPLFLDDVVVSFDREHRGMIAELLQKEFSERQVVVLTHDLAWYTELRYQLESKAWLFKTLLRYQTPEIGIRWSDKVTSFDDARAQLDARPDSAANDARKIMDVELPLVAERLQIRLPYLRAPRNDMRMAHAFMERFASDGKRCFLKKNGERYEVYGDAIAAFEQVNRLLLAWANPGSHTFDVSPHEASKLIDACEQALAFFRCPSCKKNVWFAEVAAPSCLQCDCGHIRWRYRKG